MKKKPILILTLLVLISLVAGTIYKRPVTLTQLCPEIELTSCKNIIAYYSVDKTGEQIRIAFPSGSEEFDLLMEQIQHQEFRKSLKNMFPAGTKMHRWSEGDFTWELILEFDDPIPTKDGNTASGMLIHLKNFFGDLTIYNMIGEQEIRCHTKEQQQWAEEILHIISGGAQMSA